MHEWQRVLPCSPPAHVWVMHAPASAPPPSRRIPPGLQGRHLQVAAAAPQVPWPPPPGTLIPRRRNGKVPVGAANVQRRLARQRRGSILGCGTSLEPDQGGRLMLQPGFFPQAGWIIFSNSNRQNDASLVPHGSRLAAKNKKRVVKPEIQARNVLLKKWGMPVESCELKTRRG